MAKQKVDGWVVLRGMPLFACKTRKQAKKYAEKHTVDRPIYNYVGKCIDNYGKIILDI